MGILDILWGSSGSSKKVFRTSREIEQALYRIKSLTSAEREEILKTIQPELDDGGVTTYEGKEKLNHIFYQMEKAGKISSVDYENLKKLWQ